MDEPTLTSFSLTHVYYDSADILSYISAWLALVPQALTVVYVAVIWSTREMEILLMFTGQMGKSKDFIGLPPCQCHGPCLHHTVNCRIIPRCQIRTIELELMSSPSFYSDITHESILTAT